MIDQQKLIFKNKLNSIIFHLQIAINEIDTFFSTNQTKNVL